MNGQSTVGCADAHGTQDSVTSWGSVQKTFLTIDVPSGSYKSSGGITLKVLLPKGKQLGDSFAIEECLHEGNYGGVFRARNLATQGFVALKIIRVDRASSDKVLDILVNEFHLCSKVTDLKHVLRVQDPRPISSVDLSLIVLPMEFADGGSLRDWLKGDPDNDLRLRTGIAKFKQVCSGVQAIHNAGNVHLDLKPENLLEVRGVMKVADFGIGRGAVGSLSGTPEVLKHGIIGTPEYMSPEQFQHVRLKDVSFASDIYSLGVILFEILDGSQPFQGAIERLEALHLREKPPDLPLGFRQWAPIVDRCLRKTPAERYRSVSALLRDVERVERGMAAGADMSCPSCEHLNPIEGEDAWATVCLKCGKSLPADFFRSCPRCHVPVRRDLGQCPCCHHDVAAHFRKEELESELAAAKQEDPDRAMAIMRRLLIERLATLTDEMAKGLGTLQEQSQRVRDLSQSAERQVTNGAVEQAIADWKRISDLFPRHPRATEQVSLLTRLVNEESAAVRRATEAMDCGKFVDAEALLTGTLGALANRSTPTQMLSACRERAANYAAALRSAEAAKKRKAMQEAAAKVREALLYAPSSEECLLLQKQVSEVLGHGGTLAKRARAHMDASEFAEAESAIAALAVAQADNPNVESLKTRLEEVRQGYQQSMPQAVEAHTRRDLQAADAKVQDALGFCPNACLAQALRNSVHADMSRARQLLTDAETQCRGAHFPEADKALQDAADLWPAAPNLESSKAELAPRKKRYGDAHATARQAMEQKDLAAARTALETALSICSESEKTQQLLKSVTQVQTEAEQLAESAEAALRRADFPKARHERLLAHALWTTSPKVVALGSRIDTTETSYLRHIRRARRACRWWLLDRSEAACRRAITVCPEGQEPDAILNRIQARRSRLRTKKYDYIERVLIVVFVVAAIAAFAFFWNEGKRYVGEDIADQEQEEREPRQAQPPPPPLTLCGMDIPSGVVSAGTTVERFASAALGNGNVVLVSPDDAAAIEKAVQSFAEGMNRRVRDHWNLGFDAFRRRGDGEDPRSYEAARDEARRLSFQQATAAFQEAANRFKIPLILNRRQWIGPVWGYCISQPVKAEGLRRDLRGNSVLKFAYPNRASIRHANTLRLNELTPHFAGSLSAFVVSISMLRVSQAEADVYLANRDSVKVDLVVIPAALMVADSGKASSAGHFSCDYGFIAGRGRMRWSGDRRDVLFDVLCDDRASESGGLSWKGVLNYGNIPQWPLQMP